MDRRREAAFAMGRSPAGGQAETAEQERGLSRQPAAKRAVLPGQTWEILSQHVLVAESVKPREYTARDCGMTPMKQKLGLLSSIHVLVVDDYEDSRDLMKSALEYLGALVSLASSHRGGL